AGADDSRLAVLDRGGAGTRPDLVDRTARRGAPGPARSAPSRPRPPSPGPVTRPGRPAASVHRDGSCLRAGDAVEGVLSVAAVFGAVGGGDVGIEGVVDEGDISRDAAGLDLAVCRPRVV